MKQNILDEKNSKSKIKTKLKKINKPPPPNEQDDEEHDVDENGNIKGPIDYSYEKKIKENQEKQEVLKKIHPIYSYLIYFQEWEKNYCSLS